MRGWPPFWCTVGLHVQLGCFSWVLGELFAEASFQVTWGGSGTPTSSQVQAPWGFSVAGLWSYRPAVYSALDMATRV